MGKSQNIYLVGLMKKDGGVPSTISVAISMESLLSSDEQSPAPSSPISSPVTARRTTNELVDPSQSPQSPSMATVRTAKLNLPQEKLKLWYVKNVSYVE